MFSVSGEFGLIGLVTPPTVSVCTCGVLLPRMLTTMLIRRW